MAIDTRILSFLVWGMGTLVLATYVLNAAVDEWNHWHDARGRRDMYIALGLWVVSLASTMSTAAVLFGEPGQGVRMFMIPLALGAFTYVVALMAWEAYQGRKHDGG